jgi:hypothetical protein
VAADGVPEGKLDGLIALGAPHPYVGRGSHAGETLGQFDGGKQFQPLVRTLVNKPQSVVRQFENQSWYTRKYEFEHTQRMRTIGPQALACYHTDNHRVVSGRVFPIGMDFLKRIKPDVHILMIRGETDTRATDDLYTKSIGFIGRSHGTLLNYHTVANRDGIDLLEREEPVKEVARRIVAFNKQVSRLKLSLHSLTTPPIAKTGGFKKEENYSGYLPVCIFVVICQIVLGFAFEIFLGPLLLEFTFTRAARAESNFKSVGIAMPPLIDESSRSIYHLAEVAMAPVVMSSGLSAEWFMAPIYAWGLFHFGFPEVIATMSSAWYGLPFLHAESLAELADDIVPDNAVQDKGNAVDRASRDLMRPSPSQFFERGRSGGWTSMRKRNSKRGKASIDQGDEDVAENHELAGADMNTWAEPPVTRMPSAESMAFPSAVTFSETPDTFAQTPDTVFVQRKSLFNRQSTGNVAFSIRKTRNLHNKSAITTGNETAAENGDVDGYDWQNRVCFFISFTAYLLHHTGACIGFVCFCAHIEDREHYGFVMISNLMLHLLQVLWIARWTTFSTVAALAIELWFQFECWLVMPLATPFAQGGLWLLAGSHWLWLSIETFKTVRSIICSPPESQQVQRISARFDPIEVCNSSGQHGHSIKKQNSFV